MNEHNPHNVDELLDRAIDALNRETSPAPHEHGDPELFSLVDTARLAKRLRDPAEPDANFAELAVSRIAADLRHSHGSSTIPTASTPSLRSAPMSDAGDIDRPRGIRDWIHDMSELAAIITVVLVVLAGLVVYQTTFSNGDGDTPAVGPGVSPAEVATDTEPTSTITGDPTDSGMHRNLSFEEAQEITSFELIQPDPLPEDLEFIGADVRLASNTTRFDEAYLMYRLVDGEMPDRPIIFRQIDARQEFDHRDAREITIGGRTITTFHTAVDDDGVPLAVYAWTEGDVIRRSYMVSARLAGDLTEQHLEDLIAALPEN